ncbi:hypothetical protein ABZ816_03415 [Actinosynnema sp. NPDC047251]|uniref:Uncharacterized protein n=1 Tax=Saccharothrix espanaensis (strain ATCC 51144 / DSM 44229 / JCM 9112 / NBRC 15066 / NRRL 15764) TaxID=1179773 RepID=K0JYT9_SACES|nr:hypothetical protein [Saccharothrix espanaensis]CCH31306.1 hypothetical protein BN6_40200 [Saccharothrix espanaensis DSM 44229]
MAKTVDLARVEQDARARFTELRTAAPDGQAEEHDARYADILRRARLIAASDGLADAVAAHLVGKGIEVRTDQVRVDPAENDHQVIALACTVGGAPAVLPLHPGATTLRLYPAGTDIVLAQPPLVTVDLPADARAGDHWVGAAAIADALEPHLR